MPKSCVKQKANIFGKNFQFFFFPKIKGAKTHFWGRRKKKKRNLKMKLFLKMSF